MLLEIIVTVLLSSLTVTTTEIADMKNISLVVSLPLHLIGRPDSMGLEMLAGAHVAINGINANPNILSMYNLKLIVLDSSKDENVILQQLIDLTFYQTSKKIVGISGLLSSKAIELLSPLARHNKILMTTIAEFFVSRSFLTLNSQRTMVNALLIFMNTMNWKRIGLITENTDTYFFRVAEMLLQMARTSRNLTISPYIELLHFESAFQELIKHNSKIIIASLNAQKSAKLICKIHKKRLVWPEYAWIFHSYRIEHFLNQPVACDLEEAINGILMIDGQPLPSAGNEETSDVTFVNLYQHYLSSLSHEYNITISPNRLANIMYNHVWWTAIALNKSCSQSSDCYTHQKDPDLKLPYSKDDSRMLKIFHVNNLIQILIGNVYSNFSTTSISLNKSILDTIPTDELPVVSTDDPPIGYTIGIALLIMLITIFVTILLILYISFRKQPEIKATSFTLSLFMFAGCYISLLYLSFLNYFNHHTFNLLSTPYQNAICNLLQWFSATGISLPLMLAILLVKMLRIYYIFNNVMQRIGHCCSDLTLATYVLLILAPNILINLIWNIVDRYHIMLQYRTKNGYVQIEKDCGSKYETYWFGMLVFYLLVLIIALTIVAIMTRKVRLQHFKDTKKVNVLLFIFSMVITLAFSYWLLLQTANAKQYVVTSLLNIVYSVLIIFFQSLLFLPKVFPPLWRSYQQKIQH